MRKKRVTALNLHMKNIATKGGYAVKKKYGNEYYKRIANKRWDAYRAKKKAEEARK